MRQWNLDLEFLFTACPLALLIFRLHPDFRSLAFQVLVELGDNCRRPLCINLAGRVLPFAEHLVSPVIFVVRQLRLICHLCGEVGGMNVIPSGSLKTISPGSTVTSPNLMGVLMPMSMTSAMADG